MKQNLYTADSRQNVFSFFYEIIEETNDRRINSNVFVFQPVLLCLTEEFVFILTTFVSQSPWCFYSVNLDKE